MEHGEKPAAMARKKDVNAKGKDASVKKTMTVNIQFKEKEEVMAYHGPMIYPATVLKVEERKKVLHFFIHYKGWSKRYDEWVTGTRLMKANEASILKRKKLIEEHNLTKTGRARSGSKSLASASGDLADQDQRKRRKLGLTTEAEAGPGGRVIKIPFPSILKRQLVADWNQVAKEGKLYELPRSPCVREIIATYQEKKSAGSDAAAKETLDEIMEGLRSYFNSSLHCMLLYATERAQYDEHVPADDSCSPSDVYGVEHLMRLMVKLPELLSYAHLNDTTANLLQSHLDDFIKFLKQNYSAFFSTQSTLPKQLP
eukprot:jgi/Mesvir1/2160/Mv16673-RA.1